MQTETVGAPRSRPVGAGSADRIGALAGRLRVDASGVAIWLLGCPLIVYLALENGGYDTIARNQVGLALWWFILAGVLAGVLPLRPLNRRSLAAIGLFLAFTGWSALSLTWSESPERTLADVGRVATFASVLALALLVRGPRVVRRTVSAVGTGIAIVGLISLASRLKPEWFGESAQLTSEYFSNTRLAYPLNYWNGVAALLAIGMPLLLYMATSLRRAPLAALAAAALPAMSLTIYLTYSRGGSIAAAVALIVFLLLAHDRLPKLATSIVAGIGSAILIAAVAKRPELADGLTETAAGRRQGDEMLWMTLAVCAGVGLVQAALTMALANDLRPRWSLVPKRPARIATQVAAVLLFVAALAVDVPGRADNLWEEFKRSDSTGERADRYKSFSGSGRYRMWEVASDQHSSALWIGTGSGTYENWFNRAPDIGGFVRDAHSLYMETLAELGYIGLLLLLAFLVTVLGAGGWLISRAASARRSGLAAALAGCVAFLLTAGVDWMWELAVVPAAFLVLAAALLAAGGRTSAGRGRREQTVGLPLPARAVAAAVALAAIVAIAIPLATTSLVRQSQSQAASGDLADALASARDAEAINPAASAPKLQQALIYEAAGLLPDAARMAREAALADRFNWRPWQALARIEAERGAIPAAVVAARRSQSLHR